MTESDIDGKRISRYFENNFSGDDADFVNNIFCDDNKEKELKSLLSKQFYRSLSDKDVEEKDLNHILYRIHYDINSGNSEKRSWSFKKIINLTSKIAAILLLPALIYIGIDQNKDKYLEKETWVEIKAPAWTRAQFSLPDGTTGWLNSNSSIKYNGKFISDRQVTLSGEAFFDVFKDPERPFVVNTIDVVVKALGTRFNVASYCDENNIEVVLEEGKLLFNERGKDETLTMKPNDLVVFDKNLRDYSTEEVQTHKYLSWTEGKLVFRNDPLDVIARRLGRWYNIDVEVTGNVTDDLRLRATFIDESFEQVLTLLKRSLPINYRIEYGDINPDGTYKKTKAIISTRKI
jgi:transmembrane sensor